MTKYGSAFNPSDPNHLAPGTSHNAAQRGHCNLFALATDGGTSQPLKVAAIGPGNVPRELVIETDANLSGINFTLGTPADPDKYATSFAGPNATVLSKRFLLARGLEATSEQEDIILTPDGNLPSSGTIRTEFVTLKR